ncbi:hypothetical protein GT347_01315 [Xylophilus rhododendri]|uniref:Replication-associated protein ORF2/G2P domain-containing protein n=1 Tax=Xylophilus rhododendri TaxID=2697032 RepID=A0A857J1A4_9BURK|nr:hypothetical protein [Xylophilus rhododendri]QHI96748.1 hypothetical protein GT347_01315 [Xylophilus rhododendri]
MRKRADTCELRAFDLGHGQLEAVCTHQTYLQELDWTLDQMQDHLDMVAADKEDRAEEIHEANLLRSARRAKSEVRRLCKALGADILLTLTYRQNQQDRELCKKHVKEFARRMRKALGGEFRAIAGFERQKRGAYHVHLATVRLPFWMSRKDGVVVRSYDLIRSIWRSVTKEWGGNIDVQRRKRYAHKSPAAIAAYIAFYITKEFLDGKRWSNRYASYGDVNAPAPLLMGIYPCMYAALLDAFALVLDHQMVKDAFLHRFQDFFFLTAESKNRQR